MNYHELVAKRQTRKQLIAFFSIWSVLAIVAYYLMFSHLIYTVDDVLSSVHTYKEVDFPVDVSGLTDGDVQALHHLNAAANIIDSIFYRQSLSMNSVIKEELESKSDKEGSKWNDAKEFFAISYGPYDQLTDEQDAFIANRNGKYPLTSPPGAGFYPLTFTSPTDLRDMEDRHPDLTDCIRSPYSMVTDPDTCTTYPDMFTTLADAAEELRAAAGLVSDATLSSFLLLRADALVSPDQDYTASDAAWLDVSPHSALDVTIGPYETYSDGIAGVKAAFEAFLSLTDVAETDRVGVYSGYVQFLEDRLPEDDQYHKTIPTEGSSVKVVNLVRSAGESRQGSQTLAFNLPNVLPPGYSSKQTMLYNMQEAKFSHILQPISSVAMTQESAEYVTFQANFQQTISHEFAHVLGPEFTVDGTPVREALGSSYAAIEESKADIGSIWSICILADEQTPEMGLALPCYNDNFPEDDPARAQYPSCLEFKRQALNSFSASIFRSMRFGTSSAHGAGVSAYADRLIDAGALLIVTDDPDSPKFYVDEDVFPGAAGDVLATLLAIQNAGVIADADAYLDVDINESISTVLDLISDAGIPIDIRPVFEMDQW
eukprot:gnl/Dysnectes_brevis/2393_a2836_1443.p1 GENE.gnl/Dysnectes_brevis/2393_a2836_1443~~gnl/Dysnectes_brevis/2393_a2836_1443.p1  ORF type:complete len:613 (+),score=216.85 gnl/Dysnectes_brevis/2393_a2836_1443:40-1839(+)